MPTESELRALLHGEEPHPALDTGSIIRRARARRRPKRIAAGALGSLACLAIVVPVVVGINQGMPIRSASDTAGVSAPEGGQAPLPSPGGEGSLAYDPFPNCHLVDPTTDGVAVAVPAGVTLRVAQPNAGGEVLLTLDNQGDTVLRGEMAGPPYLALGSDGTPLGYSAAALPEKRIELPPGEQLTLRVPLEPIGCAGPLPAGRYDAGAVVGIRDTDGVLRAATSIRTPITLTDAE